MYMYVDVHEIYVHVYVRRIIKIFSYLHDEVF